MVDYDLTTDVWDIDAEDYPADAPLEDRARFVLGYAILAPSSHNSQPWAFAVDDGRIEVHAVEERWLEVADSDKRELYLSVGCAVENLCVAAAHFGLGVDVEYRDDGSPAAVVTLSPDGEPATNRPPGLFAAITERHTNHFLFEDAPLDDECRERLRECVVGDAVSLTLIEASDRKESVAELQAEADERQMENADYRAELGHWVGIGALGDSWLKARLSQAVVTYLDIGDREARKNSRLIQSAPAVGVLTTPSDDPSARVEAGRTFERLALAATGEGVAVHPMSQILERPEMRDELASLLDGERRPQHLFRVGYPREEEGAHTPRWPLEKFLD